MDSMFASEKDKRLSIQEKIVDILERYIMHGEVIKDAVLFDTSKIAAFTTDILDLRNQLAEVEWKQIKDVLVSAIKKAGEKHNTWREVRQEMRLSENSAMSAEDFLNRFCDAAAEARNVLTKSQSWLQRSDSNFEKKKETGKEKGHGKNQKKAKLDNKSSEDKSMDCFICGSNWHKRADCPHKKFEHPDINLENCAFKSSTMGKRYASATLPYPEFDPSRLARYWKLDGTKLVSSGKEPEKGKEYLHHISYDHTNEEDFVRTQIIKDGKSFDVKETLLDTGTKLNFISRDLYLKFFAPLGIKEIKTKMCVCVALKEVCQKDLSKIDFFVSYFNELTSQFENIYMTAYILDMPFDFIIGSTTIKQHQLLVKCTSLGYVRKDTVKELTDYFFNLSPAGEDEKAAYLNTIHTQLRELLSKEEKAFEQEMLEDVEHVWNHRENPESATADTLLPAIDGTPDLKLKLRALCEKYSKVFSTTLSKDPAKVKPMVIKLQKASWEQCRTQTSARIQSALKNQEIQKQVNKLLALGVITGSQASKCSQVLMVPKKVEGTWRFCIDFRQLNEHTEPSGWPIPNIQTMIERIGAKSPKYFAVFDLTQGYYQTPLAPESQEATAFITFAGMYKWTRVPMGLRGAASYFQKAMQEEVLREYLHNICEIYIDDILIHAQNEDEYLERLEKIFVRLIEMNVTLNPEKCKLGASEVEFVGHTLSREKGIYFSDDKINKFLDIPKPKTQKQIKKLVGLANYFKDGIRNASQILKPINSLSNNYDPNKAVDWNDEASTAFEILREAIMKMPQRYFLDPKKPIFLHTDASTYGVGGYLFQTDVGEKGEIIELPIEFLSKAFTEQQMRWQTTDKEAYAVYYCLNKLKDRISCTDFTLRTDHENLVFINQASSDRVMRWKMAIQDFECKVEHIPGEDNIVADCLSRIPDDPVTTLEERESLMLLDAFEISHEFKATFKNVHNSIAGHFGVEKTMSRLRELNVKEPHMRSMVRTLIRQCTHCQLAGLQRDTTKADLFHTSTTHPMARLNVDTIGPFKKDDKGNEYILVIIDTFTRWVELFPIQSTHGKDAAFCIYDHIARFGIPNQFLSDNGSQFMNDMVQTLIAMMGIESLTTIPYSKEENAIVERANKEVNRHLGALVMEESLQHRWSSFLPLVRRIINSSKHSITGYTPAEMLFGKQIDLDKGVFLPRDEIPDDINIDINEWITEHVRAQKTIHDTAVRTQNQINKENMFQRIHTQSLQRNPTQAEIQIGDYVLLERPQGAGKLEYKMEGPFEVIDKAREEATVRSLTGHRRTRRVRFDKVSKFKYDNMKIDPKNIALKNDKEYNVDEIVRYVGDLKKPNTLKFEVKWEGYPNSEDNTLEPIHHLRKNSIFIDYCKAHKKKEIRQLVLEKARKHI
jgi:transposase InsO family protein